MSPFLSVLIPTRNRIDLVKRSVKSLLEKSNMSSDIEILIVHDDDDVISKNYFSSTDWTDLIRPYGALFRVFSVPRWGYRRLNEYYNFLAQNSQSEWLLIWNDDALMETDHWDDIVRDNREWRMLLHINCVNLVMNCSIFPLFHRDWIELFGVVSPINHPDSWISEICWHAKARRVVPIDTFHDRADLTGNNKDETYYERDYSTHAEFRSEEMVIMRREWAERVGNYLKNR